jgi:hypothetical protein
MIVKRFDPTTIEVIGGKYQNSCKCTNSVYYPFDNESDVDLMMDMLKDIGVNVQ